MPRATQGVVGGGRKRRGGEVGERERENMNDPVDLGSYWYGE